MNAFQRAAIISLREATQALQDHGCSAEHEEHPDLIYKLTETANAIEESDREENERRNFRCCCGVCQECNWARFHE